MPIKFRCQHCQQLLGISRSRAGAVVDCPQCGRSLRVPELDGQVRGLPDPKSAAQRDSALISALSELSVLDKFEAPIADPDRQRQSQREVVILDPVTSSDPVDVELSSSATIVDSHPDDSGPVPIRESLEELAGLDKSDANAEFSSLRSPHDSRLPPVLTVCAALILLAAAFCAGRFTSMSSEPFSTAAEASGQATAEDIEAGDLVPGIGENEIIIRGTVSYQDSSGQMLPDAGAIVLLLPTKRLGTVTWNARSLRKQADDADRIAVVAALHAIGASVTETENDGTFRVLHQGTGEAMVLVVSKHLERPPDLPVEQKNLELLEAYFDSTSHICGRLSVISHSVTDATTTYDVKFVRQP